MPTTAYGLPYPADTAPPDVPSDIQAAVEALGPRLVNAVKKTANQSVTNSIVLVNDTDLKTNLDVGVWRIEAFLHVSGAAAGDVRVAWAFSGVQTAANGRSCAGPGTATTGVIGATAAFTREAGHGPPTAVQYGVDGANVSAIREDMYLTITTAGLLSLQWAQGTASTTPTVMEAPSRLYVTRLA